MRRTDAFASNEFFSSFAALPGVILRGFGMAVDGTLTALERYRQRQALHAMPDHLLKDIGLTRVDAEREAEKPLWKP
jgi:uncharacterized protein YjiS (DUF1127 family)